MADRTDRIEQKKNEMKRRVERAEMESRETLRVGNFAILTSEAQMERRAKTPYEKAMWFSEWEVTRFGLRVLGHAELRPQTWTVVPWFEIHGVADQALAAAVAIAQNRDPAQLVEAMKERSPRAWDLQQRVGPAGVVLSKWAQTTTEKWRDHPDITFVGDHPR